MMLAETSTKTASFAEENRPSILVVDDELALRQTLQLLLRSRYNVSTAESVDKGLEYLQRELPQLVILDLNMPKKDGLQGLREIKPAYPNLPVMILTAYADENTQAAAAELGADGLMRKPFDLLELEETIERLMSH